MTTYGATNDDKVVKLMIFCKLKLQQLTMPPVMTKLSNWPSFVISVIIQITMMLIMIKKWKWILDKNETDSLFHLNALTSPHTVNPIYYARVYMASISMPTWKSIPYHSQLYCGTTIKMRKTIIHLYLSLMMIWTVFHKILKIDTLSPQSILIFPSTFITTMIPAE